MFVESKVNYGNRKELTLKQYKTKTKKQVKIKYVTEIDLDRDIIKYKRGRMETKHEAAIWL